MKKRQLIIFGSIAVVVVILIWVAVTWMINLNQAANQPQQAKKPVQQYTSKQQLVDEVNKKTGTKDYAGAVDLIERQDSVEDPNTQLLLAGAYANAGNLAKALEIYKKLDAAGKLSKTEFANVAQTAERANDNTTALAFYKKAKAYAVSSKTETADQLAVYDAKIAELEKKV
ncbi:MAG TPA: hypothetical protein VK502_03230 [Candidatus Saccharimonadales bacterium]|nr:hypothetical protein [Candidatus Saccharimonadales bacterium]